MPVISMTGRLFQRREKTDLASVMSKVGEELTFPFKLYSNYQEKLSEGKRELKLEYDGKRLDLKYEGKLRDYERKLEKKLQEPRISEKIIGTIEKIRDNYDWEKEKRQIKAVADFLKTIAKGNYRNRTYDKFPKRKINLINSRL